MCQGQGQGQVITSTVSVGYNYLSLPAIHASDTHYDDVTMSLMASQITSGVYSGADQRKHQSSASLAFVRGIHRGPMNSPHKWPVTRNMFPFDDVIMTPVLISNIIGQLFHPKKYRAVLVQSFVIITRLNIALLWDSLSHTWHTKEKYQAAYSGNDFSVASVIRLKPRPPIIRVLARRSLWNVCVCFKSTIDVTSSKFHTKQFITFSITWQKFQWQVKIHWWSGFHFLLKHSNFIIYKAIFISKWPIR